MRSTAILAAVLVLTAGLTACAGHGRPQSASTASADGSPAADAQSSSPSVSPWPAALALDPDAVDLTDPDAVAVAVALTRTVQDARTDLTSVAVDVRGGRWDDPHLPRATAESEVARHGSHWQDLVAHNAYDAVLDLNRDIDDPPPDTSTRVARARAVTCQAMNDAGWTGQIRTSRYWITLTKDDAGQWRVSELRSDSQ